VVITPIATAAPFISSISSNSALDGDPGPAAGAQAPSNFRDHANVLERHLHGRKWLVNDSLTVADSRWR
jgi:glutathione S-transferase